MKKFEIEIPEGQEIDWQESAKQEKIVFKEKQLTYGDVCEKLFSKGHYYTNTAGQIGFCLGVSDTCPNNAFTKHQLDCILAKNKLANVARYLNGNWDDYYRSHKFIIWINTNENDRLEVGNSDYLTQRATVIFKSEELAKQAIEILGEEVIKLALTPLY